MPHSTSFDHQPPPSTTTMMQAQDSPNPSVHDTPAKPALEGEKTRRWSHWKILAFGQGLSILLATMWASQSTLYLTCEWSSPAFSSSWAYLLLSLHLIPLMLKGRDIRQNKDSTTSTAPHVWFLHFIPLQASPWVYLGAAFTSFYGIYLSLLSIQYTTITSTSLFDSVSIPVAMLLSRYFLGRRYVRHHILGAVLCLVGVILNVGYDFLIDHNLYKVEHMDTGTVKMKTIIGNLTGTNAEEFDDGSDEYPQRVIGDMMACFGGMLFGANDVIAEFSVRHFGGTTEYLGMVGFFGIFFSLFQMAITERDTVSSFFQGKTECAGSLTTWLLVIYVIGQFSRKAGLALFLTMADAALLQLSLLTSDLYTLLFSIIYLHILPRPLQGVAMLLVVAGIVTYELGPKSTLEPVLIVETQTTDAIIDHRGKMV
jgi:drug/metabolite transporter (DMT)-like permease